MEAQVLQVSLHVSLARWWSLSSPHSARGAGTSEALQYSTMPAGYSVTYFMEHANSIGREQWLSMQR